MDRRQDDACNVPSYPGSSDGVTICFRMWWPQPAIELQVGWDGTGGEMSCPVAEVLRCLSDDSLKRFAEFVRDEMECRQEGWSADVFLATLTLSACKEAPASGWCPYCRRYERAGDHWYRMARMLSEAVSALDIEFIRCTGEMEELMLEMASPPAVP